MVRWLTLMHHSVMRIRDALQATGIARADAEILLAEILACDRSSLIARSDDELRQGDLQLWTRLVERRRMSEPVAYILGRQEFYGRNFLVGPGVLIPRPSTEGVVRLALEFLRNKEERIEEVDSGIVVSSRRMQAWRESPSLIVDLGTGCGCIGMTLALEVPKMRVTATDISGDALGIAEKNRKALGIESRVALYRGESLDAAGKIHEPFLLVSNPPYIPDGTKLMDDVQKYEPPVALFGGKMGTDILENLLKKAHAHPLCVGIVVECHSDQLRCMDERGEA
jgi:release factor glutamine methyltransferase